MTAGEIVTLSKERLADDYYESLHSAYNSMLEAYKWRAESIGLTQDDIASRLDVDKSLISRRFKGEDNMTLRTFCAMASAMDYRVLIRFRPCEAAGFDNQWEGALANPDWREPTKDPNRSRLESVS